jgi:hypothetical protein
MDWRKSIFLLTMGHVHLSSWLVCWMIMLLGLMASSFVTIHGRLPGEEGNYLNFSIDLFASVTMSLCELCTSYHVFCRFHKH